MKNLQQFAFILGHNPALSVAEIRAVLPAAEIVKTSEQFLVLTLQKLDVVAIMERLGGTVKIGRVIGEKIDVANTMEKIKKSQKTGRINFGFSFYGVKPSRIGLEIKKLLRQEGINSRLVTSRETVLSSVIVKKEKCLDFLALPGFFALTEVVQDFEAYGEFDFGRPGFDARAGMLPPKLAKIMINLSGASKADAILDPFCGSGTILTQAFLMGYRNLIGADVSEKAVNDTRKNMEWIMKKIQNSKLKSQNELENKNKTDYQLPITSYQSPIFLCDIRKLSETMRHRSDAIDQVITEPYLGPAWRGEPATDAVLRAKRELSELYLSAFGECKKILKTGGRITMVFPEWHLRSGGGLAGNQPAVYKLDLDRQIAKLGFQKIGGDLIYKREGQKVWRAIKIFVAT